MNTDINKNIVDINSFFWTPDYVELSAWIEHIPFAFWIIEVLKPKMVVELGVHTATSYFAFCQAIQRLNLNSTCYGVDMWKGDEHAGFYSDEIYNKVSGYNSIKYSRFSTLIRATFDEAKDYFTDGSIDLLHIDGLHTYEAVKHDFDTWLPKLSENAIVIFHDTNVRERNFGVFKLWDELKKQYPHFQFDFGFGLGILCLGNSTSKELTILFDPAINNEYYLFLRNLFADRGAFLRNDMYNSINIAKGNEQLSTLQHLHNQLSDSYRNLEDKCKQLEDMNVFAESEIDQLHEKYKNDLIELSEKLNAADSSSKNHIDELSSIKSRIEDLNQQLENQQQIIGWYKATYENRSILGILKEKLTRGKKSLNNQGNYSLIAGKDITYLPASQSFRCKGGDPFFLVDLKHNQLPAGWYWLSMDLTEIKDRIFSPKLYYNCGRGFNEFDIWNLPGIENGKIENLVNFPEDVQDLRFDPSMRECTFQIKNFQLIRLSKLKAFKTALEDYKKAYYPNESNASFWRKSLVEFLKTGKPAIRTKLRDFIYKRVNPFDTKNYANWCVAYDTISETDIEVIKSLSTKLTYQPLFSVVMPVYNAPEKYLKKAIDSVINQAYPNWELCIADDKSTDKRVTALLKEYQKNDPRIKVVFRETNGHISHASNSALELATGDYIALLDQDDEMRPHSLYMVAKTINENKNLELIYSDEDKIDEENIRFDPYFKTDWNPDLFYGQNMISHLGVYKHSLLKKIGGFRAGYEGSQDYDLVLRCLENIQPSQIHHIPHVLYHWRAIEGSTSRSVSNKKYAVDAGIRALKDHFTRTNKNATVLLNIFNSYRIKWLMPDNNPPLVSIIIPTKDKVEVLKTCVTSILEKTSYENFEIIIVDNKSKAPATFEYYKTIQSNSRVKILTYDSEFNFSAIVNYGVKHSQGEVLVLLNNDTEVINTDWLDEMVSQCLRKEIGAVGAKLYYPNGQIQHAGVFLTDGHPGIHIYLKREKDDAGYFNKLNLVQNYTAVTAACLAIRKDLFNEVGGFDEENLKVAYNDVDFCLRVRSLGYQNLWTPYAQLIHYESLSRGNDFNQENIERFKKEHSFMLAKWKEVTDKDPFYNHNLAPESQVTQFARPPKFRYEW